MHHQQSPLNDRLSSNGASDCVTASEIKYIFWRKLRQTNETNPYYMMRQTTWKSSSLRGEMKSCFSRMLIGLKFRQQQKEFSSVWAWGRLGFITITVIGNCGGGGDGKRRTKPSSEFRTESFLEDIAMGCVNGESGRVDGLLGEQSNTGMYQNSKFIPLFTRRRSKVSWLLLLASC